jgi:hypothetical protein
MDALIFKLILKKKQIITVHLDLVQHLVFWKEHASQTEPFAGVAVIFSE